MAHKPDDPRFCAPPDLKTVAAIKAVDGGFASPEQQKLFMNFLFVHATQYGQAKAYFGVDASEKAHFVLGRQLVGQILTTYIATPIEVFNGGKHSEKYST